MTEQYYNRQQELGLITGQRVAIVGCGGVGSWLAYFLALAGVGELTLYDSDHVEEHNLNRLPLTKEDVGEAKSVALRNMILRHRPDCYITPRGNYNPVLHNLEGVHYVACCTDSLKSRRMVYEQAQRYGCCYLELGADGHRGTVSDSPGEWQTELEERGGYQVTPVFVGPCTAVASVGCYYILHGTTPRGTLGLDWDGFGVRVFSDQDPAGALGEHPGNAVPLVVQVEMQQAQAEQMQEMERLADQRLAEADDIQEEPDPEPPL